MKLALPACAVLALLVVASAQAASPPPYMAPYPQVAVFDSKGFYVGPLLQQNFVVIYLNVTSTTQSQALAIRVAPTGFVSTADTLDFSPYYYATSNCSGASYMPADGFPPRAYVIGPPSDLHIAYPSSPYVTVAVKSYKTVAVSLPPTCKTADFTAVLGKTAVFPLIARTPPFTIKQKLEAE
jgi:hypothetical protein